MIYQYYEIDTISPLKQYDLHIYSKGEQWDSIFIIKYNTFSFKNNNLKFNLQRLFTGHEIEFNSGEGELFTCAIYDIPIKDEILSQQINSKLTKKRHGRLCY